MDLSSPRAGPASTKAAHNFIFRLPAPPKIQMNSSRQPLSKSSSARSTDPTLAARRERDRRIGVSAIIANTPKTSPSEEATKLGACWFYSPEARPSSRIEFAAASDHVRLIAIAKGAVRIEHKGLFRTLQAPHGAFVAPSTEFVLHAIRSTRIQIVLAPSKSVDRELGAIGARLDCARFGLHSGLDDLTASDARMMDVLRLISADIDNPSAATLSEGYRRALGQLVIASTAARIARAVDGNDQKDRETAPIPQTMQICLAYIERNHAQPIRLTALAGVAGVTLRTLQIHFRRQFGCTISDYIRNYRLQQAHQMLSAASAGDTVSAIARFSGFDHLGDFASVFRARYGIRPSEVLRHALRRSAAD